MYAEERQRSIAELVLKRGRMSVADLADEFDVTTETIRRDLSVLERTDVLRRVHGGAVPTGGVMETVLSERDVENADEKERISKVAIDLLGPTETSLLIDAGSTTGRLAGMLPRDRALSVITHAIPVAFRIGAYPNIDLQILPGRIRPVTQAAVGSDTVAALSRLRADVAFIGANGISVQHGLSTPDPEEAAAKRAMVAAARRVIAVADSSKIDRDYTVRFAELGDIDVLVTDARVSRRIVTDFTRAGVEVVIA